MRGKSDPRALQNNSFGAKPTSYGQDQINGENERCLFVFVKVCICMNKSPNKANAKSRLGRMVRILSINVAGIFVVVKVLAPKIAPR